MGFIFSVLKNGLTIWILKCQKEHWIVKNMTQNRSKKLSCVWDSKWEYSLCAWLVRYACIFAMILKLEQPTKFWINIFLFYFVRNFSIAYTKLCHVGAFCRCVYSILKIAIWLCFSNYQAHYSNSNEAYFTSLLHTHVSSIY